MKDLILRKKTQQPQHRSSSIATALREQKAMIKAMNQTVLLLDVSGSMSDRVGEKSKIAQLCDVANSSDFAQARKVIFSSFVQEVSIVPERTHGSTDMTEALEYVEKMPQVSTVILVSDGLPDNPNSAYEVADRLSRKVQINTIYIGPGGDAGDEFMQKIAQLSGGQSATVDTTKKLLPFASELKKQMVKMLPGR